MRVRPLQPTDRDEWYRMRRALWPDHDPRELDEIMPRLIADRDTVYCHFGSDPAWDARIGGWISAVRARSRAGVKAPAGLKDVHALLDEMRLVKDEHELGIMRRAAEITGAAHRRAMRAARPGLPEYAIEAELLHEFRR